MKGIRFSLILVLIAISFIFIFYDGVFAETKLRNTPSQKGLNEKDVETLVKKCNFFDKKLNETGDFPNDFVDNGNGTVTDRATGLMWEQKGSKKEKSFYYVKKYVKSLNKKRFAGYDDWRIPTIEELYSLLETNMNKQLFINPVFATKAYHCWSTDESDLNNIWGEQWGERHLTLDYEKGTVSYGFIKDLPISASAPNDKSFIRAVRSIQ